MSNIPDDRILLRAAALTGLSWLLKSVDNCRTAYRASPDFRAVCEKLKDQGNASD